MNKQEVVEALKYLEAKNGKSPSVAEIAEYCECSAATAWKYLNEAEDEGLIVKSGGKFMTHAVAEAYRRKE
jgi:Fic family protein